MPYSDITSIGGLSAERFGVLDNDVWLWLPAVADPSAAPLNTEIEAGTRLQCSLQTIAGFSVSPTFTNTPDLCNRIDGKVFDGATVDDSSITFYAAREDNADAKDFFTTGQTGFIMRAPYGLVEGYLADLWPVEVGTVTSVPLVRGPSAVMVSFAPSSPLQGFTIPASTT